MLLHINKAHALSFCCLHLTSSATLCAALLQFLFVSSGMEVSALAARLLSGQPQLPPFASPWLSTSIA